MSDREISRPILKQIAIFSDFSDEELGFVSPRLVARRYRSGEAVFHEGDPCTGLFIVQSGNVRIFKISAGGREQVLSIDGPGSSIAELPVFDGGSYPASAVALSETQLWFFRKQDFQTLCLQHPPVALKILRVMGGRLRRLVGIIEELSFTTVRQRLIALLVRLGRTGGDGDAVEFPIPANNSELAAQIGTVRELVSRNLSRLQSERLIDVNEQTWKIPSLKRLESELQDRDR
jgi:CRP/FNR family cyclic AMP-dependent transcriptional regulator